MFLTMGCEDVFHLVRTDETYLFCLIMVFEDNFHLNFHLNFYPVREDVFTIGECKRVSSWCVRMFFTW